MFTCIYVQGIFPNIIAAGTQNLLEKLKILGNLGHKNSLFVHLLMYVFMKSLGKWTNN